MISFQRDAATRRNPRNRGLRACRHELVADRPARAAGAARPARAGTQLGSGGSRPFRRDAKSDLANMTGIDLVRACVGQVLGTQGASPDNPDIQGEIAWDPQRGSLLHLLRHHKNDSVLQELGRVYVHECLRRWEPRLRVSRVQVTREMNDTALAIRVIYDVLASNESANQVLFENVDQTVTVRGST